MNAQQMHELCRELMTELSYIAKANPAKWGDMLDQFQAWVQSRARFALDKAKTAFNPTPNTNGCVETAATVSACVGTGEAVKALGVGPCCPVCGNGEFVGNPGWGYFACGFDQTSEDGCEYAEPLAITRAKQLAEAEAVLSSIATSGWNFGCEWCFNKAKSYFRNKPKEPTA